MSHCQYYLVRLNRLSLRLPRILSIRVDGAGLRTVEGYRALAWRQASPDRNTGVGRPGEEEDADIDSLTQAVRPERYAMTSGRFGAARPVDLLHYIGDRSQLIRCCPAAFFNRCRSVLGVLHHVARRDGAHPLIQTLSSLPTAPQCALHSVEVGEHDRQ
jgi:hypothetical protein